MYENITIICSSFSDDDDVNPMAIWLPILIVGVLVVIGGCFYYNRKKNKAAKKAAAAKKQEEEKPYSSGPGTTNEYDNGAIIN